MVNLLRNIWQGIYPYGVCRTGKAVYLTFDDGPQPDVTPRVLEILRQYDVRATFFMVGENIDKHPDVFHQVIEAGHAIGNHTYNHLKGWRCSTEEYIANVRKWEEAYKRQSTNQLINQSTTPPLLFRPPYGRTWIWQRRAVKQMGYEIYLWDVLTRDYNPLRTPEAMLRQIKHMTRPGSIINFHDSIKSNERMLAVLPPAIEWLVSQGYSLEKIGD